MHNHDSNNDYNIENMDMKNLLTEMKKKFNPKRPSLSKFMWLCVLKAVKNVYEKF